MIERNTLTNGYSANISPIIKLLIPFYFASGGKNGVIKNSDAETKKSTASITYNIFNFLLSGTLLTDSFKIFDESGFIFCNYVQEFFKDSILLLFVTQLH